MGENYTSVKFCVTIKKLCLTLDQNYPSFVSILGPRKIGNIIHHVNLLL